MEAVLQSKRPSKVAASRPEGPEHSAAPPDLRLRPFGQERCDIETRFDVFDRPSLITEILSRCLEDSQRTEELSDHVWDLPVSTRIEWLLRLVALSRSSVLPVRLLCPRSDCRAWLEIELEVDEIVACHRSSNHQPRLELRIGQGMFQFRRPTGRDQREWRQRSFPNERDALQALVERLQISPVADEAGGVPRKIPSEQFTAVEEAMDEFDPLVAFSVQSPCPECGVTSEFSIDLEAIALAELETLQRGLIEEVHRMASHYHWTESEILTLPAWRRARYLRLIEKEIDS